MTYRLRLSQPVEKDLKKLGQPIARRILKRLHALKENPRPRGCKKLAGSDDLYRIRIGDWRAVYTIQDHRLVVLVVRVAHRSDVYR